MDEWIEAFASLTDSDAPPDDEPAGRIKPRTRVLADAQLSRLDQLRAALLDSDGLEDIGDPVPLVGEFLFLDSLAWLHAKPGHCKSVLALDWAGCVANGRPWNRHRAGDGARVLYLAAEGVTGQRKRVRAWEHRAGEIMGVTFLPIAVQLLDAIDLEALVILCRDIHPALIVIDTQARCAVGAEENSAKDMGLVVQAADRLRMATGACVLILHHEPRSGENMRGSTSLEGAANTILRITKKDSLFILTCTKQKDADASLDIAMRLEPVLTSVVLEPDDTYIPPVITFTKAELEVLAIITDTPAEINDLLTRFKDHHGRPLSRSRMSRHLNTLLAGAQVDRLDLGRGRAQLWTKAAN